ncbi:hypothetical protein H310_03737 [Aphanomyces invadans]|uniref:Lysosomal dipeptide transporter MFSD1 n=1 Tax=Aphanomyces invadans TaxID=157072 RepID=A0A024UIM7_9STRA|nr:hypothetical protein H310_03737 [Aphanomyces invadans]ETW06154.1 hypothetical protein H310_03737 [Aphanomyces invadans]|eukprot:XP_008865931.1 hypothetical protein H310_03737 [Aphanomyces invadans]
MQGLAALLDKHIKPAVLVLVGFLSFGGCYCYDNPSALKSQLTQHFSGSVAQSDFEMYFNLLYSVYSVPNIVLPLFGGILADKFGPRYVLVSTTTLVFLGQVVFAIGNSFQHLPVMLIGRVIFGLGGETVSVAQSALLALWFPASELIFAKGIILSVMRLATTTNNQLSPTIAEAYTVSTAVWVGAAVCLLSVMASLLLVPIDATAEQQIWLGPIKKTSTSCKSRPISASPMPPRLGAAARHVFTADGRIRSWSFWLIAVLYVLLYSVMGPFTNIASGIYMERDYFRAPPVECQRCGVGALLNDGRCIPAASSAAASLSISSACPPSPPFAYPLPALSASYRPWNPVDQFNSSKAPPYMDESSINCDDVAWKEGSFTKAYCDAKFHAEVLAAAPLSLPSLVMALLAPVSGYFIDHIGCRAIIATATMATLAMAQALLGFPVVSPFVPCKPPPCASS